MCHGHIMQIVHDNWLLHLTQLLPIKFITNYDDDDIQ